MAEEDGELQRLRERKLAHMIEEVNSPPVPVGPLDVTDADFEAHLSREGLTVVDCWAPWCGPCRMLAPVLDSLSEKYAGRVSFLKLNTDLNQRTAARFAIMSIPTVLIFKDGQPVERIVGAQPEKVLDGLIRRHLS